MNKLSKRFLLTATGGAVLIAVLFVGLDLYVGSKRVQMRLESALSKELGAPVKVGGLHYSLWRGLRATGVSVATAGPDGGAQSSLVLPEVSARVAFGALFSHRLVLKRLVIAEPVLVWGQNRDGGWNLPVGKRIAGPVTPPALESVPSASIDAAKQEPQPESAPTPISGKAPKVQKHSPQEFSIKAAYIKNATLRFVDHAGVTVGLLEGVTVKCPSGVVGDVVGNITIGKATLHDGLTIEEMSSPFAVSDGFLTLSQFDARLAGGSVRGSGKVATTSAHPLFTLDLLFDGVDIHRLLTAIGEDQAGRRTAGTLHGNVDIYGRIGKKKSMAGTGYVRIRGGRMEQIPLLQLIGKVLTIDELTNLELQQAQLDLRAGEGKVFVDSLVMESNNLSLTAVGTSGFDGKLDLAAKLAINPKIGRQLPSSVEANFQPIPGSDRRALGFRITGTIARPETDLMRVLVGQKYENQMMDLWRTLTGKHKKKTGDKKKPEPEVTPTQDGEIVPGLTPHS